MALTSTASGVGPSSLNAQIPVTANTMRLDSATVSPPATLAAVAWLEGHWRGTGLGGVAEEVWMGPNGGAMAGAFRVVAEDAVLFYEMMVFAEHEGSVVLRLKHFHADMTGWEEKDDMVTFRLVRAAPGEVQFNSLTFRRLGDDRIEVFVAVRQPDGQLEELGFSMSRVR